MAILKCIVKDIGFFRNNMSNISWRHHFIPQFYLKGFYEGDSFVVYDKECNKFKKDNQTTKMVMFERDRNIITVNGIKTDDIEKLYANLDTNFSDLFKIIQQKEYPYELLSIDGIRLLRQYIAIQFWRTPLTDPFVDNFIANLDLSIFPSPIFINGKKMGESDEFKSFLQERDFRYYFRCFFLPHIFGAHLVTEEEVSHWTIYDVEDPQTWSKHIVGDHPFIFNGLESVLLFNGDLIFPLSRSRVLVRRKNGQPVSGLPPDFSSKVSTLIFAQSQKYVTGPDKQYINDIMTMFERWWGKNKVHLLREEVLTYLK
ncbi:TPA: DUF4238 domain-containing protein [Legionella pneumophila]|nr:DUF4238 domain-containing protein [Legionella pneumophila]HAU0831327.1 DUF4238 domain-containing protein [Legionella pneumophila]HAU0960761.1 DUF4238 domain-containing protein [Legionella pneumophila]